MHGHWRRPQRPCATFTNSKVCVAGVEFAASTVSRVLLWQMVNGRFSGGAPGSPGHRLASQDRPSTHSPGRQRSHMAVARAGGLGQRVETREDLWTEIYEPFVHRLGCCRTTGDGCWHTCSRMGTPLTLIEASSLGTEAAGHRNSGPSCRTTLQLTRRVTTLVIQRRMIVRSAGCELQGSCRLRPRDVDPTVCQLRAQHWS